MRELYAEIEPYNIFHLKVDDLHTLYVEECGSKDGIPVIFLHGGPGAGCNSNHRRYFDPGYYRIIIFDQRGTNRSMPRACVEKNTTRRLLDDIEAIRTHLALDQCLLFGGSWGATLALLYAQACPQQVAGIIVRGAFLARKRDLDWFISAQGAGRIFPDFWQDFMEIIPEQERSDMALAYYRRLQSEDAHIRNAAVKAWASWSGRLVTYLLPGIEHKHFQLQDMQAATQEVTIETHYARHGYFIEENQILNNVHKLPTVPIHIIHGRRDLTCLLEASWDLHHALPESILTIVNDGGHLAGTASMVDALISATDGMIKRLQ